MTTNTKKVKAIYPLTPMQEGMLFHTLYEPEGGMYIEQVSCRLKGEVQAEEMERAWQAVVERHEALRSRFAWKGLEKPVQVVDAELQLRLEREDWRGLDEAEQESRLEEYLGKEREEGFDLSRSPLMRLALLQMKDEEHVLVWSFHHLLMDGWSLPIVLEEVFASYQGEKTRREPIGEAGAYRDYVRWLQKQDMGKAEKFWRERLKGFRRPTVIGVEEQRGEENRNESSAGERSGVELSAEVTRELERWARQHQLTLNTLVQGAWSVLLSRYSGERDVVFGGTVSGRPGEIKGIEKMVGLFINTLPVRVEVKGEEQVGEWLRRIQEQQVEQGPYEYSPLAEVQRWSEVESGAALFESIVVFENYPVEDALGQKIGESGLQIEEVKWREQTNYPLVLTAGPGARLLLRLEYDGRRYETKSVERMLRHLKNLLEQMAEGGAEQRVGELSLLTEQEREQLLVEWNRTKQEYGGRCVQAMFEEQVRMRPEAIAVVCGERELSYGELNRRANQVAHYLKKKGVGAEKVVGICMEPGVEMVVGILGAVKAGGAYLALDGEYPGERLGYMVEDSGAKVVLVDSKSGEKLEQQWRERGEGGKERRGGGAEQIWMEEERERIGRESEENPGIEVEGENLAYVIYTSGSTGKPKGVMLRQSGLVNLVEWHVEKYGVSEKDRATQVAGTGFDASVWEVWPYLVRGASLWIAGGEKRRDAGRLVEWLEEEEISLSFLPTPLAEVVLEQMEEKKRQGGGGGRLKLKKLLTGGDKLHRGAKEELGFELVNHYGPTENTVVATCGEVGVGEKRPGIGKPIGNTEVYVLDGEMELAPVGVVGELYVGGAGLARGYLGQAELTAERFVAHRYGAGGGERVYRTGDLCRWRESGELEFVGRADQQVKVRGYRIELGEIESVLGQHGSVGQAAVVVREEERGGKRLVGYVVRGNGQPIDGEQLREYMRERLPEYMVPGAVVEMEELPLTVNGKVDRERLPEPARVEGDDGRLDAPQTGVEEVLCGIWAEVLGVERVGIHDNFFELGGNSLLAMQVIARICKTWNMELELRRLFEKPTVAELGEIIERKDTGKLTQAIEPIGRANPLPLSFAQHRLWFIDQLEPDTSAFTISFAVRLAGQLDVSALRWAIDQVIRRHEALRTTFRAENGGEPEQVICPAAEMNMEVVDLCHQADGEEEAERQLRSEEHRHFDLAQGPLFRSKLLCLSAEQHILILSIHHIIFDGWSLGILMREAATFYRIAIGKDQPAPSPLFLQYADFAAWQREWLTGETLQKLISFWTRQLQDAPQKLGMPLDHPRPAVKLSEGAVHFFNISETVSQQLHRLARKHGATVYMTLLSAVSVLLWRYTGQDDACIGTPVAGRSFLETKGIVGFFINMLPMRVRLAGNPSFHDLVRRVREMALQAYTHQDLPFEQLIELLQPARERSRTPLFQVTFALHNVAMDVEQNLQLPELEVTPQPRQSLRSNYDFSIELREAGAGIKGNIIYDVALFHPATIERMAQHLQTLLERIAEAPEKPISDLTLLSEEERRQVLVEWNDTALPYAADENIAQHFERQVAQHGESPAVYWAGEFLTYNELNRRANRLAHYLRREGVGAESMVAVCLERSPHLIVALLGILKAGGAYLPLAPDYPNDRLAFMLTDSAATVVLTDEKSLAALPSYELNFLRTVCFSEALLEELEQQPDANLPPLSGPENLAYVTYTSGSTGMPKGVQVTHRGVARLIAADYIALGTEDVMLQMAPIAFDASTLEIWGALLNGGRLVLSPSTKPSLEEIEEILLREKVTTLWLTAPLFHLIVQKRPQALRGIKQLVAGGDVLSPSHVRQYLAANNTLLINGYGPTEGTTFTCCCRIHHLEEDANSVPIGRPISNTQVYVLDEDLQPAPIGVAGELLIAGDGLARGYLNRPELTAERFIPDPFSNRTGARMYRSGDRVRYMQDGNLEFLGRKDMQVKIRGFRIEPGEIETVLQQMSGIKEAAVAPDHSREGDKRLVAYVTSEGAPFSSEQLRSYLAEKLPEYMIPALFIHLPQMPLSANGKVDRKSLPSPEEAGVSASAEYDAPRNATEETLARIWAEVLGVKQVGIHDNFFELGGDSILSIRIKSQAQSSSIHFPLQALFDYQTIAKLSAVATTDSGADKAVNVARFALVPEEMRASLPQELEDAYPLSMLQAGMVFHSEYEPASGIYHDVVSYPIGLPLDGPALQEAVNQMVKRHAVLRTAIDFSGREPIQKVYRDAVLTVEASDLREQGADEQRSILREFMQAEKVRNFHWASPPLLRLFSHRLAEQSFQLSLSFHHALWDGWSEASFVTELVQRYRAILAGTPLAVDLLPVGYREYIALEQQSLVSEESCQFWADQLQGFQPTPVPLGKAVEEQTSQVRVQRITIPEPVAEALQRHASSAGVPVKSLLLATHLKALAIFAGTSDITTGVVINGRPETEGGEEVLGLFLNTVPFRMHLGIGSWTTLMQQTFELYRQVFAHRRYPLPTLAKQDSLPWPLFETAFNYTHFHVYKNVGSDLQDVILDRDGAGFTNLPFLANFWTDPRTGHIGGVLECDTSRISELDVQRIADYYSRILACVAEAPQRPHFEAGWLVERERRNLLEVWNAKTRTVCEEACLHELFQQQAERTPHAIAVSCVDRNLTYEELNHRANQLARRLKQLGIGPDTTVGLCLERSLEMVVGILGVLKAGGAYVPLDPEYPDERLAYILNDSGVGVLLTQKGTELRLPQTKIGKIVLDEEWSSIAREATGNLPTEALPGNAAYVIYTSGSTGSPKGVIVTHQNAVRLFASTESWFNFGERDVWTLFHSYAFDFSVWELWGALLYGGRLVVVPYWISRAPEAFYELLREEKVTVLSQTPSAFRQLSRTEEDGDYKPENLALRLIIFGGEALEMSSLKPWMKRHGERMQLVNMYGITETTVHVTYALLTEKDTHESASLVGCRIPDLQVYVLGEHLEPVPLGVVGELYVGGAGVARGYLNRPELTAERFIADPFSPEAARLYKSGDLARYREDGALEYFGRIDHQVKVRGYRIELGEIEAALEQHPSVSQSVVLASAGGDGEKRLVAYVVGKTGQPVNIGEVRNYLKERLPDYMVPAAFIELEALPLTAHGKIDRRALPDAQEHNTDQGLHYDGPREATEEQLCTIWAEVLGQERVGIRDNFFELGGDSILSIQVVARSKRAGLEFAVRELFAAQTVENLAQLLRRRAETPLAQVETKPFSLVDGQDLAKFPEDVVDAYPLTRLQAGMLFHSEYSPEAAVYHNISTYRIAARFDCEKLRQVLERVLDRHPVLRTSFDLSSYSEPLQLVHRQAPNRIEVVDLGSLSPAEQDEFLESCFETEKCRAFDVGQAGLIRFLIHPLSSDVFQFTLVEHHAILDGWSVTSLLAEIFDSYSKSLSGSQQPERELASSFRDFVALERQVLEDAEARDYWKRQLDGMDVARMPWRTGAAESRFATLNGEIDKELSDGLKKFAREAGVSIKSVLLAAHFAVMRLLGGQPDVVTGLVSNGRVEKEDGDRVLGLFLNTLPLHQRLAGGSWAELVQETAIAERKLLPHRRFPMAELQSMRGSELFTNAFNFLHFHNLHEIDRSGIKLLQFRSFERTNFTFMAHFGLDVSSSVQLRLDYDSVVIPKSQVEAVREYYRNALYAIVSDPQSRYESSSLLSAVERKQVVEAWNATKKDYAGREYVHELFEKQAERRPEAIAVGSEEEDVSYAELNRRSNRLAHYLARRRIGAENQVGIYMERSAAMVVSLLGVLKAGGAYVPLDPEYPRERVKRMAEESGIRVVLTQEKWAEQLQEWNPKWEVVAVDAASGEFEREREDNPGVEVSGDNLAYVIYTSGSTGGPKGAMVTRTALKNRMLWQQERYSLSENDVVLQKTPYSFDVSVWEFFWPLTVGARLEMARPDGHRDSQYLIEVMKEKRITVTHFVPAMLRAWVEAEGVEECVELQRVFCSGEALEIDLCRKLRERLKQVSIHNLYGPTETTVEVSHWEYDRSWEEESVPIGQPVANTQFYVLDQHMQPAPVSVTGELYIGGVQVGRGYVGKPQQTAERFVANPFGGDRLYKTGDLCRYRADGNVEYLGRIDQQVKVRGNRIELGEIENALLQHAGIGQVAVMVREGEEGRESRGEKRLVAYVRWSNGGAVQWSELKEYLKERLPEYMVPGVWVEMEQLPLTTSGKVDRKKLPEPEKGRREQSQEYVAARNEMEEKLCVIWSQVLGVERIGIHDNFFDLGGDSILATQAVSRIRKTGYLSLPLKSLFQKPTIANLAREIEQLPANLGGKSSLAMKPFPRSKKNLQELLSEVPGFSSRIDVLKNVKVKQD